MDIQDFQAYQRESRKTWGEVHVDNPIVYPTLGLTNEAGEVAGKIKKIFRDKACIEHKIQGYVAGSTRCAELTP